MTQENTDDIDIVNQPLHYKSHPSGIECIQITEHISGRQLDTWSRELILRVHELR